jgi:hypothetical protein
VQRGMPLTPQAPRRATSPQQSTRTALLGGEYRRREREVQPEDRTADNQDRSLGAVFDRMSGSREELPDPRSRSRTSPGLSPVFGRLR